jgi:hypothetical protein
VLGEAKGGRLMAKLFCRLFGFTSSWAFAVIMLALCGCLAHERYVAGHIGTAMLDATMFGWWLSTLLNKHLHNISDETIEIQGETIDLQRQIIEQLEARK